MSDTNNFTQVQTTTPAKGNLVLSVNEPTPMWATWGFRIVFLLTTAISIWLAGTHLVSDANKVEIIVAMKAIDVAVWGLGKMLGIQKPEIETDEK